MSAQQQEYAVYKKHWGNKTLDNILWIPTPIAMLGAVKVAYHRYIGNTIIATRDFFKKIQFINMTFVGVSSVFASLKIFQLILQDRITRTLLPDPKFDKNYLTLNLDPNDKKYRQFTVKTHDGIKLDTLEVILSDDNKPIGEQQYLIHCNMSCSVYQQAWRSDKESNKIGVLTDQVDRAIFFNYRGTGKSRGKAHGYIDLVNDVIAQVRELLDKGVNPKNIHLYGHSMGGGVSTYAAYFFQKQGIDLGSLIVDRTYGILMATAESTLNHPIVRPLVRPLVSNAGWDARPYKKFIKFKGRKMCIGLDRDRIIRKGCMLQIIKETYPQIYKEIIMLVINNPNIEDEKIHNRLLRTGKKWYNNFHAIKIDGSAKGEEINIDNTLKEFFPPIQNLYTAELVDCKKPLPSLSKI